MRYYALACDYDGTLAQDGRANKEVIEALKRLRDSGRKLLLVTGRELDDLLRVFPAIELFDRVVAENGALLYNPATREERQLGEAPAQNFLQRLRARGVEPLSVGRVIVATWQPHEKTVLDVIRELGLERQVIFNKGAVMILPSGINKATGLAVALSELGLSAHNVIGVGDAENDHAFLKLCECSVAVANALPALKEKADLVTRADHGAGVIELIERILKTDLKELLPRQRRHHLLLGWRDDGQEIKTEPAGLNILLAGTSGSGKSTFATGFFEGLREHGYQFCIIDPEGDYENLDLVVLGDTNQPPNIEQVVKLFGDPDQNGVINMLGIKLADRPAFFERLLIALLELRTRTGRPHWLIIDEAHHLLPIAWSPARQIVPEELTGLMMITVHPDRVAPVILSTVNTVVAIGDAPRETVHSFCRTINIPAPALSNNKLPAGEAILWRRPTATANHSGTGEAVRFRAVPPRAERIRHHRKYTQGELPPERSFYFRGPNGKLNLRAQNLTIFMQSADGVDDDTWLYHLRRGDYSRWFLDVIKDPELASDAARIEKMDKLTARRTRELIKEEIERRYTAPA